MDKEKKNCQELVKLVKEVTDQTGFTEFEKMTLRNTLSILQRHVLQHAFNTFIEFFATNEHLLNRFRLDNGRLNSAALNKHPKIVLRVYARIIMLGLNNYRELHSLLLSIVEVHLKANVRPEEVVLFAESINKYVFNYLGKQKSQTLINAMTKISNKFESYFKRAQFGFIQ